MNREAYIAAMQKIDLSDQFTKETLALLQSEESNGVRPEVQRVNQTKIINPFKSNKLLKTAAIILVILLSTAGITAAAAKLNITDIFKGYFKEPVKQGSDGGGSPQKNPPVAATTAPVKEDNKYMEEASAIISSTVTAGGLKLTARGIVGDRHTIYTAVDVETQDGSAFDKANQHGVSGLSFNNVWLKTNDDVLGQYCYITRVDDGSEPGKATFVLKNSLDTKGTVSHLNLTFTNLTEPSRDKIIDIGATKSLLDIVNEIGEASEDDFDFVGGRCYNDEDWDWYHKAKKQAEKKVKESGAAYSDSGDYDSYFGRIDDILEKAIINKGGIYPKYCLKRTDKQAAFCTKYPGLSVSNIGIRNNQLCVRFELNKSMNFENFRDSAIIMINRKNGNIINGSVNASQPVNGNDESQSDSKDGKIISCGAQFSGVSSKEALKDYYFAFGGRGYSEKTLFEGEWNLSFDLSYTDTTREYPVSEIVKIGGADRKLENISISPLSLQIKLCPAAEKGSSENSALDSNIFDKENRLKEKPDTIKIIMKDNSEVVIDNQSCEEDTISSVLPAVIDIDQAAAININGTRIDLPQ